MVTAIDARWIEITRASHAKYWTGKYNLRTYRLLSAYSSVVGQPATGLLVKVLKMRHQNEMTGGHWTFVRKMYCYY